MSDRQAFHLAPLSHPLTSALWFRASENNLKYQSGPNLNKKITPTYFGGTVMCTTPLKPNFTEGWKKYSF